MDFTSNSNFLAGSLDWITLTIILMAAIGAVVYLGFGIFFFVQATDEVFRIHATATCLAMTIAFVLIAIFITPMMRWLQVA